MATTAAVNQHLPEVPWTSLGIFPTPLHQANRLSQAVGRDIWFKRDDLSGFGMGGNKVRALEFLIGEARLGGADCLVTGAGPQSNWAMLAALAARVHCLEPFVVLYGSAPERVEGNLLLHDLSRTRISYTGVPDRVSVDEVLLSLTNELKKQGRQPLTLPRGGATATGALGYVAACAELRNQFISTNLQPEEIWIATGSCCSQAGLVAGRRRFGLRARIRGAAVSRTPIESRQRIETLAEEADTLMGSQPMDHGPAIHVDDAIGPGYGKPSKQGGAAAQLVAETEGIFLDAAFGAKAMAALLASPPCAGPVIFIVTGGLPTLFQSETVAM